jgi:pimeloyl-ACP methyl ester carboxylesterase
MSTRWLVMGLVALIVLAGCVTPASPARPTAGPAQAPALRSANAEAATPSSGSSAPAPTVSAATARPGIDLKPCTVGSLPNALCGTLSVYENRAAATGRQINLRMTVIPASGTDRRADPIFYLAGGPGGAASDDIPFAMQLLGGLNGQRDLVFVDQRGTGNSHKLTCSTAPVGVSPGGDALAAADLQECLAGLDGDPAAYTTAWGMDDLDDVRIALGYDQINLYGGSYGPTAAQVYILRHGTHVRTAALTGASLLEVPMFEWMPRSSQHALEVVLARCEADASCRAAYPNVRTEFAEIMARLDRAPIELPLTDPATGAPVHLTRSAVSLSLHNRLLLNTASHSQLPLLIHSLYTGNLEPIAAMVTPSGDQDPAATWQIMSLTILCNEDWAALRRAETEQMAAGSYMTYADARAIVVPEAVCAAMPRPQPEAMYGSPAPSPVPILFLTGEADPQDPETNVAQARQRYSNSRVLVAPGQAHNYTGISCRAAIIKQFVDSGSLEGLDTGCLAGDLLPAFDVSGE